MPNPTPSAAHVAAAESHPMTPDPAKDKTESRTIKLCDRCGGWMIFSFAIDGCEYVCPRCKCGREFFNGCREIEVAEKDYAAFVAASRPELRELYLTHQGVDIDAPPDKERIGHPHA